MLVVTSLICFRLIKDEKDNVKNSVIGLLVIAVTLSFTSLGCQSSGSGGYGGSDGHYGHSH